LNTPNSNCSRADYWFLFATLVVTLVIFAVLYTILNNYSYFDFKPIASLVFIAIIILDLVFQAKRLNDASISKWFLLIHLFRLLGLTFGVISYIVMLAILCLPTQEIPTTNLMNNKKE